MMNNIKQVTKHDKRHAIAPPEILLYQDYKEPLRKVEVGYGYMGTVAMSEDRQLIQCHICGYMFQSLGGHLRSHKIKADEYKDEFQLSRNTALVGDVVRRNNQLNAIGVKVRLPEHLKKYNKDVQTGKKKHEVGGITRWSLERRNREELCPDQVLEKIKELAELLEHTPTRDEFTNHYNGRYISSIRYIYGSWGKALEKLGKKTVGDLRIISHKELIQDLKDFYERFGYIPMGSDFNRGQLKSYNLYIKKFGSLNNARVEAGLNAILPMGWGKHIELTPNEYEQYKITGESAHIAGIM